MQLSIIVPIYNVEKYLDRCMESLLNQTLGDIEIIMVDDGSPDRCPQMCDKYAKRDNRIKVVHKKNGGLGYARNSGLEVATGEYVAFVDSDDYVDIRMYETLYSKAVEYDADAVFCGLRRSFNDKRFVARRDVETETIFFGNNVKNLALDFIASEPKEKCEHKYEMSVWHSIYRSKLIKDASIKFMSERDIVSEDLPFQVEFFKVANTVCFIPDVLYTYCMNNTSSLTNTFKFDKFYGEVRLFHYLRDSVATSDPSNIRAKRFFIGYMRSMSEALANAKSSLKTKKQHFKDMLNNEVWAEVSDYPSQYLPLSAQLFFFLQRKKCIYLLYIYSKFYTKVKIASRIIKIFLQSGGVRKSLRII